MKHIILALFITLTFSVLVSTDMIINKTDGTEITIPLDEIENITFMTASWNEVTADGITFKWMTDDEFLYAMVTAPTTGWVSAGFDPTNQMADANIIIGYVESNGTINIRDDFGDSPYSHSSDISLGGTDDVTNISGSEEYGITELNFTIPLSSGDNYDRILEEGNTYSVILAYGVSDDFESLHTVRTTVNIEL